MYSQNICPTLVVLVSLALGNLVVAQQAASPTSTPLDAERLETLAWQIALEAAGFSPGLLDGVQGLKTETSLQAFQQSAGLTPSGQRDAASRSLLEVTPELAVGNYTVTREDDRQVSFCPPDWIERSKRDRLWYLNLATLLAEKFHTSARCLGWLNPTVDLDRIQVGDSITVPRFRARNKPPDLAMVEIDLERKLVLLLDARGTVRNLLHCSVARDIAAVARGETTVKNIVVDPDYTFDPAKWPEVKGIDRKLTIPPGPRSPVGVRWVGLDRPGIGLHGSPEPENIGKTGSHGCFRLTNWDAVHLASVVKPGMPVRIVDRAAAIQRQPPPGETLPAPRSSHPEQQVLPPGIRPKS